MRAVPWGSTSTPAVASSTRQNCSGILMAARLSFVKNPLGGSAITAALIRGSVARACWFGLAELFAECRSVGAPACEPCKVRRGADQRQAGVTALGKAEQTDPVGIDRRLVLPAVQHKVDQANHVGRARQETGQFVAARSIVAIVTRMIDRRDDEARVGQRRCGVMVSAEPAPGAVRNNHQRQPGAGDRTILHALQPVVDGHREIAKLDMLRLSRAGIPDGAGQGRTAIEKLNARSAGRRSRAA